MRQEAGRRKVFLPSRLTPFSFFFLCIVLTVLIARRISGTKFDCLSRVYGMTEGGVLESGFQKSLYRGLSRN